MTAVAAGRKDEWLALFAPDAVVEDPVGPSLLDPEGKGHHGHDGIGRFWDRNFGAVSRFHFQVKDSFANGLCCANIAAITMWLGDAGATMTVDGVMIYTVNDDGRITSIRGHWEPDRAMATLTGPSLPLPQRKVVGSSSVTRSVVAGPYPAVDPGLSWATGRQAP